MKKRPHQLFALLRVAGVEDVTRAVKSVDEAIGNRFDLSGADVSRRHLGELSFESVALAFEAVDRRTDAWNRLVSGRSQLDQAIDFAPSLDEPRLERIRPGLLGSVRLEEFLKPLP